MREPDGMDRSISRNTTVFVELCSGVDFEMSSDARKKQAAAQLPSPLTEAIVRNARAELSLGEWGLLEQCITCYGSQRMSASDLLFFAKTMAPRSTTLAELFRKPAAPAPVERAPALDQGASADDMACLLELSRTMTAEYLGKEACLNDTSELTMSSISDLPAPAEPAPTKPLSTQRPPAEKLRYQKEQRELLERFNRLVYFDQLIESKMQEQKKVASSDDTAEPMPRTPPRLETRRSSLQLNTAREEEPVPLRIQAPTKPPEMQRPTLIQLLRQSEEIQAKQDNQDHHNDTEGMGVLAEMIELKKQLKMKMSVADEKDFGQYYKGHVTLKSLATQAKGEDAILSLSDGNLSLVGGAELDQMLLSMPCSHVVLQPVPGHDNCIHFKTTKKNDKTAGLIIVLPSRLIRDKWLAASCSMDIKIEKWHATPGMSRECSRGTSKAALLRWLS